MGDRRPSTTRLLLAVCLAGAVAVASADPGPTPDPGPEGGAVVALTASRFHMKHPGEGPWGGGVEYRWAPLGRWKLIPGAGFTAAGDGAGYAYASLHYDFRLGRSWVLTPVFGAGAFRNGDDLDLGYGLQFKSGLELSVRVAGRYRIGLLGYHLSNGSLADSNPGTEVLELVFAVTPGRR